MVGFKDYFVDHGRLLSIHLELVTLPYVCLIITAVGTVNRGLHTLFTKKLYEHRQLEIWECFGNLAFAHLSDLLPP